MVRFLSSPFFLIAAVCFFLPFFALTCAGTDFGDFGGEAATNATEVTGLELVTGEAEQSLADMGEFPTDFGEFPDFGGIPTDFEDVPVPGASPTAAAAHQAEPPESIDLGTPQIWAIAAAAVAILGIFLSLLRSRTGGAIALALGLVGAVLLFLLASAFKDAIFGGAGGEEIEQFLKIEKRIGFWGSLAGFSIAAVIGLLRVIIPERPRLAPPATASPGFGPPPTGPPPAGWPPAAPPPADPPPATPPTAPSGPPPP